MSRRRQAVKRPVVKDAKYGNVLVSRLVNTVMKSGKKSTAQRIVYGAFDQLSEKNPTANALEILQRAVDNAKPRLEVKPRRVGGATYQVPVEVTPPQGCSTKWLSNKAEIAQVNEQWNHAPVVMDSIDPAGSEGAVRHRSHRSAHGRAAVVGGRSLSRETVHRCRTARGRIAADLRRSEEIRVAVPSKRQPDDSWPQEKHLKNMRSCWNCSMCSWP